MEKINPEILVDLINMGKITINGIEHLYKEFGLIFTISSGEITECRLETVEELLALEMGELGQAV